MHPLIKAGVFVRSKPERINAVSAYSGGGYQVIAEFAFGDGTGHFFHAMDQQNAHVPEIQKCGGLIKRPVFLPSVGQSEQGMVVPIPLLFLAGPDKEATFVSAVEDREYGVRLDPRVLNGTNRPGISMHSPPDNDRLAAKALLDNLGKGASGAAVQTLDIMLGLDEPTAI